MHNIPFADEIHAFLEDDANVEALTDAVQELNNICINGTSGLLLVGFSSRMNGPNMRKRNTVG